MHNNTTQHLYEAFLPQHTLYTLRNSSSQHSYEEGKYYYLHFIDSEIEKDKSSKGIIRGGF